MTITGHRYETNYNRAGAVTHELFGENVRALDVARQIRRREANTSLEVFKYRDKGQMATIGRRKAVVEMRSWLRFQGSLAWLTWLALHLAYLSGGRNRTSIFADWIWNYIVWTPRRTIVD